MTAPLKWRSQLCPCGFCPPGTRVYWRYAIDIHFAKSTEGPLRARTRNVRKALEPPEAGKL